MPFQRVLLAAAAIAATLYVTAAKAAGDVVVVELFQSQGCSSCPPANANVNALSARPDLLVLSFGVTYWDRLGWKDTFATPQYTNRQYDYAKGLGNANVYTPQVVIGGRRDITGINRGELEGAIASAPRSSAQIFSLDVTGLSVRAGAAPRAGADIWLVRYDPRTIAVPVQAGENDGRTLPHTNIVRELTHLGVWTGTARTYPLPPPAAGLRTAILLQEVRGGPILAAVKL